MNIAMKMAVGTAATAAATGVGWAIANPASVRKDPPKDFEPDLPLMGVMAATVVAAAAVGAAGVAGMSFGTASRFEVVLGALAGGGIVAGMFGGTTGIGT